VAQGSIVPFVSRSILFARGMIAQCEPLRCLLAELPERSSPHRAQCEWALERLLQKLPFLPHEAGSAGRPPSEGYWDDIVSLSVEPEVIGFANRCTAILDDLLTRSARASLKPAAS
jgi:hypothetical protein